MVVFMAKFTQTIKEVVGITLVILMLNLTCLAPVYAQYVVNNGDTVILETQAGTPYTINDSSVVINGLVRIYEINGSGVRTGNGGYLVINSSGGINLGSTGSLNANAAIAGGNGGFITLNGNTLTINGLLTANGLGSGRGGIINMIGNTIDVGALAVLSARAGSATSNGGEIDIDGSGIVTIANGAVLASGGLANGTSNLIEIAGTGVNINGLLNATGVGNGTGGTVTLVATTNGVFIGSTSQVLAFSSNGNGGAVNLDGDVTVEGSVQAHTGANARTGGVITITGTNAEDLTVQNGGILYVNGRTGYTGSAGHGGTIDVDTGSVRLLNGYVKAEGGWTGGNAGTIDIRSTNGDITVGNGMQVLATGDNNGTVLLSATGGATNINAGGAVKAMGNQATTLTLNGDGVTVAGLAEAGGWRDGHGGTLNINSLNNTDVTISSGGIVSSRGAQTGVTNGGNINISGSRDVILSGATSGANTDRPNDAHIRVYGNESAGTLGQGGVITITAGDDFLSNQFVTVNANGTTVPSGSTYTQGVINITATDTATIDGIYQVGGRASGNGGGGLIDISAGNDITVDATSVLEASVSNDFGTATGDGGRIDITSTNGNIGITGGSTVIGGVTRGLIDFSSGVTGDGGQLNITANNGNITFANANLLGTSNAGLGGLINVLSDTGLVNANNLSVFNTTGALANATSNRINVTGNTLNLQGNLIASSTGGDGGYIQLQTDQQYVVNGFAGLDVSGTGDNGTVHLIGSSVDTAANTTLANGTLHLEATSGNVNVDRSLNAQNILLTTAGIGDIVTSQTLTATDTITISSGDAVNIGGQINTGVQDLVITGNGIVRTSQQIGAANSVQITSTGNLIDLDNNIAGNANTINLQAATGIDAAGRDVTSGNAGSSITVNSTSGNVNFDDVRGGAGGVNIQATNGNINVGNTRATNGNVSLVSNTGSVSLQEVETGTVDLTVQSVNTITTSGVINTSGDVSITSTGDDVIIGGTIANTTDNVTINAADRFRNTQVINASDSIDITAGGIIDLDNNLAGDPTSIRLSAGTGIDAGNRDLTGGATGTINVTSTTGDIELDDVRGGSGNVIIRAFDGNITMDDARATDGTVTIISDNGNLTVGDALDGTDTFTLQSAGDLRTTGTLNVDDTINLTSTGGDVVVTGTISTGVDNVTINANDRFRNSQVINADNNINITSGGLMDIDNTIGNADTASVTLNAGTGIDGGNRDVNSSATGAINITSTTGNIALDDIRGGSGNVNITATAGNIDVDQTRATNGDVNLNANTTLDFGEVLTGTNNVTAQSGGTLRAEQRITVSGNVNLTSTDGNVQNNNTINAGGNVIMTANGTGDRVTVNGDINAVDVTLSATGTGGTIYQNDGDSIVARNGSTNAGGTVTMTADGKIRIDDDITATGTGGALGGRVIITSNNGNVEVDDNNDVINTSGASDATHNRVDISGTSTTLDGTINTNQLNVTP